MRETVAINSTDRTLVRGMTRYDLAGISINGIIGAGIFGLPSAAARLLGTSSPIAFGLCALIVYLFVLCFAEAGSRFKETGGPYLYSRTVFGRFIGFEIGWAIWLSRVSAFAANSNLLVSYLGVFIPQVSSVAGRVIVLVIVPAVLMVINIRGVTGGARFGVGVAVVKVGVVLLFGIIGLAFVDWSRFSEMSISTEKNWAEAILLLVYAYTGFENTVIASGEAKDPSKDLAWALISALGICAVGYVAVQIVALGTVPNLALSDKPLADSAQTFLGPVGGAMIAMMACVSLIGNLSSTSLAAPRLTFAFAEQGDFPA